MHAVYRIAPVLTAPWHSVALTLSASVRRCTSHGTITPPAIYTEQRAALLDALSQAPGEVILVSNEVGMGIVPMGAVSRWFTDEAGRLNQALASCSERVIWVAAGLPLYLKNAPQAWPAGGTC